MQSKSATLSLVLPAALIWFGCATNNGSSFMIDAAVGGSSNPGGSMDNGGAGGGVGSLGGALMPGDSAPTKPTAPG